MLHLRADDRDVFFSYIMNAIDWADIHLAPNPVQALEEKITSIYCPAVPQELDLMMAQDLVDREEGYDEGDTEKSTHITTSAPTNENDPPEERNYDLEDFGRRDNDEPRDWTDNS